MRRRAVVASALVLGGLRAQAAVSAIEAARIERLIGHVENNRRATFVRNGTAYSCREAAGFLRRKYEKIGEHVNTAAQFIDQIASRPSTGGQPYLVRFADGRTVTAAQFLGDELRRMDHHS
jgi:Family of unknown function (DUF5329)